MKKVRIPAWIFKKQRDILKSARKYEFALGDIVEISKTGHFGVISTVHEYGLFCYFVLTKVPEEGTWFKASELSKVNV